MKGGLLLAFFDVRRPTRDIDLLARFSDYDERAAIAAIGEVSGLVYDDGVTFHPDQIRSSPIREDEHYSGVRIVMPAGIGKARFKLSLDINVGDPVTPGATAQLYPQLLEGEPFSVLIYPLVTAIAEKLLTCLERGEANTRDRDWADIWRLSRGNVIEGKPLRMAIEATGRYRGVKPEPVGERIGDLVRRRKHPYRVWRSRQGAEVTDYPEDFHTLVDGVVAFADPVLADLVSDMTWDPAGGGWVEAVRESDGYEDA